MDLYEEDHFRGRKIRLYGPADFTNLYVGPDDWGDDIRSAVAGPGAWVFCFEDLNVESSGIWLAPGHQVNSLSSLALPDESAELDSIRLYDRPPFASEPGYAAYARAHGLTLTGTSAARRPKQKNKSAFWSASPENRAVEDENKPSGR